MTDTMTDTQAAAAEEYARRRDEDWQAFAAAPGPPPDRWARWEEATHGWRQRVAFMQPVGLDYPDLFEPLASLLATLEGMEEIDIPPLDSRYLNVVTVGHLMSTDIMWSQTETFYVNAAPRIHRLEPFSLRFRGISIGEDAIYLGVEDGYALREVRRQIGVGVRRVYQTLREEDPDGTRYVPCVEFAYFTGKGSRERVVEALAAHRDADLGQRDVSHIKMARISSDPAIHYPPLDVIAEIGLLGKDHRRGYHN